MGLLDFIFRKKSTTETRTDHIELKIPHTEEKYNNAEETNFYTPQYFNLLNERPKITDIFGRRYDLPKYSDKYITKEGYKLREILLLVWWGKAKTGRKSTIHIPQYFFTNYNLNAERLTSQFKVQGLLVDTNEKTLLTEKGKEIYNNYCHLWEIHAIKNYPINLDLDFPNWNKEKFELELYKMEMRYYNEYISYCKKMIQFFNSFEKPIRGQKIYDEINYYMSEGNTSIAKVTDLYEKISILEDKVYSDRRLDIYDFQDWNVQSDSDNII